ncbi:MAG TPA: hypothetical protein VIZ65_07930 [Cellvibrionaceae bacterium]
MYRTLHAHNILFNISLSSFLFLFSVFVTSHINAAPLPEMAPPKIQMVDEFGVDLLSGQITHSLNTVSIGGDMGVSHSISSYTNNLSMTANYGYHDKYYCKGRAVEVKRSLLSDRIDVLSVIRVNDISDTADFIAVVNGARIDVRDKVPYGTYTYEALADTRHTLERRSDGLIYWTKPDGTVSLFDGRTDNNDTSPNMVGMLMEVRYPNGFVLRNDWVGSKVVSNTGYALKYIYQYMDTDAQLDKPDVSSTQIPQLAPKSWAALNPRYVQAINLSKEDCLYQACNGKWPQAEFIWPPGMPRSVYIGDSQFKVIDASGGITLYSFKSFDLAFDENGNRFASQTPGVNYSPRLMAIKPVHSEVDFYQYKYKTLFDMAGTDVTYVKNVETTGATVYAKKGTKENVYEMNFNYQGGALANRAGTGKIRLVIPNANRPGTIQYAETNEGKLEYENSWRNALTTYTRPNASNLQIAVKDVYEYASEGRNNLTKVTKNGTSFTAEYPPSCDETNRKYCNKPTWVMDAKGNKTYYTYHAPSGQIETITYPADNNGLIPAVRYEYAQKSAHFYHGSGSKITGEPIWLKATERTCATTNTMGNGCSGGELDEIVTQFEYEHDNLHLTGVTITAADTAGTLVTKRTCYQYDDYGNRIGETQPKAALSVCTAR